MPSYSNNYSKWDQLELSDDSDIEGHPNVDHKSLVRWKQRDIHEKREIRKHRIAENEATVATNKVLLPRLRKILKDLEAASPDRPPADNSVTYDFMIESLLNKIYGVVVQEKGVPKDDADKMGKALCDELSKHIAEVERIAKDAEKNLVEDLAEQKKHITSEDLKVGFDSKYAPPPPEPKPEPAIKPKGKKLETAIETLNAPSSSEVPSKQTSKDPTTAEADELFDGSDDEEDDSDLPTMTPALQAFSKIPVGAFERSYEFLQNDKSIFVEGATDALLLQGFHSEMEGKSTYAKQCVHQGLLIQYCEKLGRDGIGIFFKRMMSGAPTAVATFTRDVEETYTLVKKRVVVNKEEQAQIVAQGGVEQIQLVAENPETIISFDVPDGPPPENLVIEESPETEGLDVEEVRKVLQSRWDIFCGFDERFQRALKSNKLDNVNKVLGKMPVTEAENIVELLQVAGILQFAEGGIRDETGRGT